MPNTPPDLPGSISSTPSTPPSTPAEAWLEIGRIVGAQGLQGELRIYPDSDFPERFEQPGQRWLRQSNSQTPPQPVQLQRGRLLASKGLYVIKLQGVDSREQAEALKGSALLIRSNDRPKLAPGEFYLEDLIGLRAINQQTQAAIGKVVGIVYAGNTLLEIELASSAQKVLVPFVEALVPMVDLTQHQLEIVPLPGLFP
jgi:16S rRNA processing protein RimM